MLSYLPQAISTYGGDVDSVLRMIYWIVGVWFVAAEMLLLFFVLRYRRREGIRAGWAPATTLNAMAWVLVPVTAIMICDLAIEAASARVWERVKEDIPAGDVQVRITGSQFAWRFTYAGPDGRFESDKAVNVMNDLYVPAGKVVHFQLEAVDVIHSLWIPNLRLKQDAVPGRSIPGWFEATQEGVYPIGCAQLCGMGHGVMKGKLHVLSPAAYASWLTAQTKKS
ncbi:MAG: hypothetical protein JOY51_07285 [Nevskia sp.]|nr:hypothetical protein [Nevskia sp.]